MEKENEEKKENEKEEEKKKKNEEEDEKGKEEGNKSVRYFTDRAWSFGPKRYDSVCRVGRFDVYF